MTSTQALRRSLLLLLPAAALLLAGCTASTPAADDAAGEPATDMHSWSLQYASCMRDEGIDYPDPGTGGDGAGGAVNMDALGSMDVFAAADETCRDKIGDPPAPTGADGKPLSDESRRESMLEITQCLREQGVEIEDPREDGGLMIDDSITPEALEACGIAGNPVTAG